MSGFDMRRAQVFVNGRRVSDMEVVPRSEAEALAEALGTVTDRATYGYQDMKAGGVLLSVKRVAGDALAAYEAKHPKETP